MPVGFTNYNDPNSFGSRMRRRRAAPLRHMIDQIFQTKGTVKVIDLGGAESYWNIFESGYLESRKVSITLVNLYALPHDDGTPSVFTHEQSDACSLSHADSSFDIAHSNSVIEHVGDWSRMKDFAREVRRVAPYHFVQTPNFWFPVEPHCLTPLFHWLPKGTRLWLLQKTSLGHWKKSADIDEAVRAVESARLLTTQMMTWLFPDSSVRHETFLFLRKSIMAMTPLSKD